MATAGPSPVPPPDGLREETARLLADYLDHRLGGGGGGGGEASAAGVPAPPSRAAETLRRVAAELERRERPFFRGAASEVPALEAGEAGVWLARVAAQMAADGGLNWGRVVALAVFAGHLAAALERRGDPRDPTRQALAEALAAFLAGEQREWLEAHGGWDGFYHFFNKQGSDAADQNSTLSNAIMAAAGFGLAGLAFLLAVR